jgi:probable HAF family extracellular repeat protein
VGAYMVNGVAHGYVYSTGGGFTTVDYPASTYTNVTGRNSSGVVVGRYLDSASVSHGYILSNGQFTSVDYPVASFTGLTGIDPAGNITGRCTVEGVTHGFVLASTQPAARYMVTDLGLVGRSPGQPITITDNGLIAGMVTTDAGFSQAVVWNENGGLTNLGSAGLNSMAFGINDSGLVVGQAEITVKDSSGEDFCGTKGSGLSGNGATCAAFAAQNGTMKVLGTLGGVNALAYSVNSRGQIAGAAENTTVDPTCPAPQKSQFKPVLWQGDDVEELPTIGGDLNGFANGINENGDVVGASGKCAAFNPNNGLHMQPLHALLWETGRVVDLGNLGGTGQVQGNFGHTVNNNREVVGWSDVTGDRATHAFRWTKVGGMEDLGTLSGDGHSIGLGLNDGGIITGVSASADFSSIRAFVWRGGSMMDLNQLIPATSPLYLLTACSVNARGEIIGFAVDSKGNLHGYLVAPIVAGAGDFAVGVSAAELSKAARSRMRSVGMGIAGRKVNR